MNFLFLFLDGVGLGADNPASNPFARAEMPNLSNLLGGRNLVAHHSETAIVSERATLLSLDACLGVEGLPQSASGQATLLTGRNVPAELGYHYGPKPNPAISVILEEGNIFATLKANGLQAALLNAFPQGYFQGLNSGKRLPGAVAMASLKAGIALKTEVDLFAGQALSADFSGKAWRERLGYHDAPVYSFYGAGQQLARLAENIDFAFFEFWISDVLGHRKDMDEACLWLKRFDQVLGGLLAARNDAEGLILITSDHGNLEDLSTRRHTINPVPGLIIGNPALRQAFAEGLRNLSHITPAIQRIMKNSTK